LDTWIQFAFWVVSGAWGIVFIPPSEPLFDIDKRHARGVFFIISNKEMGNFEGSVKSSMKSACSSIENALCHSSFILDQPITDRGAAGGARIFIPWVTDHPAAVCQLCGCFAGRR
jgi:hypothetical protein